MNMRFDKKQEQLLRSGLSCLALLFQSLYPSIPLSGLRCYIQILEFDNNIIVRSRYFGTLRRLLARLTLAALYPRLPIRKKETAGY
jgi:hypothetical protein